MKQLFVVALFCITGTAFAAEKVVCEVAGKTTLTGANLTVSYAKPLTYEECYAKGEELFNSSVTDGLQIINPFKNILTVKKWTTQYKTVKIKFRGDDGVTIKEKLERAEIKKENETVTVIKLKSGFKCWTKGECEPSEE